MAALQVSAPFFSMRDERDSEVGNTKLSNELVAQGNMQNQESLHTCGYQPTEQTNHADKIQPWKMES